MKKPIYTVLAFDRYGDGTYLVGCYTTKRGAEKCAERYNAREDTHHAYVGDCLLVGPDTENDELRAVNKAGESRLRSVVAENIQLRHALGLLNEIAHEGANYGLSDTLANYHEWLGKYHELLRKGGAK